jgi:hypothetical protein
MHAVIRCAAPYQRVRRRVVHPTKLEAEAASTDGPARDRSRQPDRLEQRSFEVLLLEWSARKRLLFF